jgi:hypothetical protein
MPGDIDHHESAGDNRNNGEQGEQRAHGADQPPVRSAIATTQLARSINRPSKTTLM